MKYLATIFSVIVLVCFFGCKDANNANMELVTAEEMASILKIEGVQLIDVRTAEEFAEGFIKGAQNIDFFSETFDKDILALDKSKPVVLYCRSGGRSAKCSEKLIAAGFVKIYDLDGGITQWKHEKFDISMPE